MRAHRIWGGLASVALATASWTAIAQDLPVINRSQLLPYPSGVPLHPSGEKYQFGCGIAINGNRMLVSAAPAGQSQASLFFYTKNSSGSWAYAGRISPPSGASFECEVALRDTTAAVSGRVNGAEAVFVLQNTTGSTWKTTQTIKRKGSSLYIGPNFLALGNPTDGNNRGLVRIYDQVSSGTYQLLQNLTGPDLYSNFGRSLTGGSSTLVVTQSSELGENQKIFVYVRSQNSMRLQKTFDIGYRALGSVAYDSNYLAFERTVPSMAEIQHRQNGMWTKVQTVPGDEDPTGFQGWLGGPIALGGNRFVFRDLDTNKLHVSELRGGFFRDTAILNAEYGYFPTISSNTIVVAYPYIGPENPTFRGAVEIFSLPRVVN